MVNRTWHFCFEKRRVSGEAERIDAGGLGRCSVLVIAVQSLPVDASFRLLCQIMHKTILYMYFNSKKGKTYRFEGFVRK
jgi:hypothetical protein